MSTAAVLKTPTKMGSVELISPGSTILPSEVAKITVEGQVFEIKNSLIASSALGKLRRSEDGSYRFPENWNVRATQFSTLLDLLLHSTK